MADQLKPPTDLVAAPQSSLSNPPSDLMKPPSDLMPPQERNSAPGMDLTRKDWGNPEQKKKGFVESFVDTFHPVKAITEEGIIPQLGQYAKRKITGKPAPKAKEEPERQLSFKESFNQLIGIYKSC